MYKMLFFPMAVLSFCTTVTAQKRSIPAYTNSRYFVEVAAGPAFPVGGFSHRNYDTEYGGLPTGMAKTGNAIALSAGFHLKGPVGILFSVGGQQNDQPVDAFVGHFRNMFQGVTRVDAASSRWKIGNIMGGGMLRLPLSASRRLVLEPRLLGGFCKTTLPAYRYSIYRESLLLGSVGEGKRPLRWIDCFQLGTALKYFGGPRLYFKAEAAIFRSQQYTLTTVQGFLGAGMAL